MTDTRAVAAPQLDPHTLDSLLQSTMHLHRQIMANSATAAHRLSAATPVNRSPSRPSSLSSSTDSSATYTLEPSALGHFEADRSPRRPPRSIRRVTADPDLLRLSATRPARPIRPSPQPRVAAISGPPPPLPSTPPPSTVPFSLPVTPTSPPSPASPFSWTFSPPRHSKPTTATFSSYYERLHRHRLHTSVGPDEDIHSRKSSRRRRAYSTAKSELSFSTIPSPSSFQPKPATPPIPRRRVQTAAGAVGAAGIRSTGIDGSGLDYSQRLCHGLLTGSIRGWKDSHGHDAATIPVNVRYVPKDLWIQIDLPRNIPVHKARDLILTKCRLTSLPGQEPSPSAQASVSDSMQLGSPAREVAHSPAYSKASLRAACSTKSPDTGVGEKEKSPLGPALRDLSPRSPDPEDSASRTRRSSRACNDDDSLMEQESIDDDEAELRAEELMADEDLFTPPEAGTPGLAETVTQNLQGVAFSSQRLRQQSYGSNTTSVTNAAHGVGEGSLTQHQLKQLLTYSSLHKDGQSDSGTCSVRTSRDRFSNLPGWNHYRSRQSSSNGRLLERDVLDHDGTLADSMSGEESLGSEETRSDCMAWKACFGLFWVAAGHWLDHSRLVSSYGLQPYCLLELQLRNNYIQLPPPGGSLNYYDHYAEGILFKLSKKSRPVSRLTRDCSSMWKEQWVVLQGSRLFLYHKRKDTTKKTIDLTVPLTVITTTLPQDPRHSFKLTPSPVMSSTLLTITTSDPNAPKLCFRATSESELNHWNRIFNSFNCHPTHGLPSFNNAGFPIPPPPLTPPPSVDESYTKKTRDHQRHRSLMCAGRLAGVIKEAAAYASDRKRSHTTQSTPPTAAPLPAINPILISSAAAALSNLNSCNSSVQGDISPKHHRRSDSQSSAQPGLVLTSCDPIPPLESQRLIQGSTSWGREDERRQRTYTEPGTKSRMSLQDHYKQRSKVSTPEDEVPKGGSAVTPSEPSQESKQQLPGTESLDAPSKQLLERVCPENSLPPLFWGYIWLYIPNSGTSPFSSNTTSPHEGVLEEPKLPRLPSQGLSRSTSRAGNISIKKATGRYIKCFSVISSEGQLHWVEAANNDEVDRRSESCKGSGSRTSYSLLLDSSAPCKNSASSTARNSQCFPDKSTPSDDYQSVTHNGSDNWPQSEKSIQASMAHKLRLYFFCIKISTSSLPDVRLEKTEVQEEEKSVRPRVDKRSEIKARNRISAPIATRPMTLLQLSSSGSSTPAKTRTLSGTFPSGFLNQPVWPSMSPFNERQPPTSSSTISQERLSQALAKVQMKSNSPRASFIKAATLFAENRIRSAPPGSIIPQRPTPPLRPLPLTRTASISSQRSLNLASKGIQSIASSPSIEPRSRNSLDMRRTGTNSPGPDMFITTINLPSPVPVPRSLASPPLGQRSLPSPTSPTTSNVLNLAEGLRNALMSRQLSLSSSDSNSSIATDDSQSSKNPSTSSVSSPGESDSGWNARKPKMSLSETMAAKRATLTEANAASAAAAILASREQSRYQLVHGRARGTSGAEDYFSYRGGVQHKRSAPLATTMESEHEGPVEGKRGKDEEKYAGAKKTIENIMKMCPFLEKIEGVDGQGRGYVTLKGYTETEEAWKTLQVALEQFIDGPIKDQRFALPPEDTLIPSYHAPRIPEVRLSEKAQNFLLVRDKLTAAAAAASAAAMLRMGTEGQPMTGSTMATNSIPTGSKSPGKSGSTKNAFGRFSRQLGGRDWGGGGHGYSLRQKAQQQQLQRRSMPITKQSLEYLNQNDVTNLFCFGEESNHSQSQNASRIGKQTAA